MYIFVNVVVPGVCGCQPSVSRSMSLDHIKLNEDPSPQKGDSLSMHYTGTIAPGSPSGVPGKQFDSSLGRDVFSFTIGSGQVIKGWDQGKYHCPQPA